MPLASGYIIFMTQQILTSCLHVSDIIQGVDSPAENKKVSWENCKPSLIPAIPFPVVDPIFSVADINHMMSVSYYGIKLWYDTDISPEGNAVPA